MERGMVGSARAPTLVIRLLGHFSVGVGDRSIGPDGWRLRKGRHLLVLLALAPDRALHREQLADALWPAHDPAAAAGNLRQALHAARRVLTGLTAAPEPTIIAEGERLRLGPADRLWIDVVAFEAAATTARRERQPTAYRTALDLYTGDLLPDDVYEDWTAGRREELRALCQALLAELAECAEAGGDVVAAVAALERLVGQEPTHEAAQRRLLTLYARTGQRQRVLRHYQQLRAHLWAELAVEPEAATRALVERIAAGASPDPPAAPADAAAQPGNLPVSLTRLIGREEAVTALAARLMDTADGPRLVTLTGAGGVGKTRLALAVAHRLTRAYPDGAWLVDLAPLTDATALAAATAAALGVRVGGREPLAAVLAALRSQRRLLVIDNCEHVVADCAPLVLALLETCAGVRVLATSRVALGVPGELRWRVPSLALPDPARSDAAAVAASAAATLFVERARQVEPAFALTSANATAVAVICRQLDGIPLALELAAARLAVLTPAQLAERLDDALAVLTGGPRAAPPRQRTLRATLEWSYGLLDEDDRRLLRRLAVFAGDFTLAAAEAVFGAVEVMATSEATAGSVLEGLARLIDSSLLVAEAGDPPRYRLLEPVRQDAWRRLVAEGVAGASRRRHADYYLAQAARITRSHQLGDVDPVLIRALERDYANLRAALHWALAEREADYGLRLVAALLWYWSLRGELREGRAWSEAVLALDPQAPAELRQEALLIVGALAHIQQDYERTTTAAEAALALALERGDAFGELRAQQLLGLAATNRGDFARADDHYAVSLALVRPLGEALVECHLLNNRATLALFQGDLASARELLAAARAVRPVRGRTRTDAYQQINLAVVAHLSDEPTSARAHLGAALGLLRALGDEPFLLAVLGLAAAVAARGGEFVVAAQLLGAVEGLTVATGGSQLPAPGRQLLAADIAAAHAALGAADFATALAAGQALAWPAALDLVERLVERAD